MPTPVLWPMVNSPHLRLGRPVMQRLLSDVHGRHDTTVRGRKPPAATVAFMVTRGAVRCPLGRPADGMRKKLPKWRDRTVSRRAPRFNRPECRLPVCAHCCVAALGGVGAFANGRFGAVSSGLRMSVQGREAVLDYLIPAP